MSIASSISISSEVASGVSLQEQQFQATIQALQFELEEKDRRIARGDAEIGRKTDEIEALQDKLNHAQQEANRMRLELTELSGSLSTSRRERDTARHELLELKQRCSITSPQPIILGPQEHPLSGEVDNPAPNIMQEDREQQASAQGVPRRSAESQTAQQQQTTASPKSNAKAAETAAVTAPAEEDDEDDEDEDRAVLDKNDQKTIVNILLRSNALSAAQHAELIRRIDAGNPAVAEVFRRYEQTKDVLQLGQELVDAAAMSRAKKSVKKGARRQAKAASRCAEEARQNVNEVETKQQEIQAAKAQAMKAIEEAKTDLLKHSLDMMVKQKLITEAKAQELIQRHRDGDRLTDAAIEAYAADRDVHEFIDTLQLLATHSKEELEGLMNRAIGDIQEQEEGESAGTATAAASENASKQQQAAASPQENATALANAQAYISELALQQVGELVQEMRKNDMISPAVAGAFQRLIDAEDERLVEAYKQFMHSRDGTKLIDSLLKIVIASVQGVPRRSAESQTAQETAQQTAQQQQTTASPKSNAKAAATAATRAVPAEEDDEDDEDEDRAVLDKDDQKTIANILLQSNALSAAQYAELIRRIDAGNPAVAEVFRRYEQTKAVLQLVQDLQGLQLVDGSRAMSVTGSSTGAVDGASERDDGEDDDEEGDARGVADEDDNEGLDEDDAATVEQRFMHIIHNMELTELEQTALRLAIAENDPAVRNAIDAFRFTLDEDRLIQAMRNAARAVIHRTLASASRAEDDEEDMDEEGEDEEDDDEEDDGDYDEDDEEEGKGRDEDEEEEVKGKQSAATRTSPSKNGHSPHQQQQYRSESKHQEGKGRDEEDDEDDEDEEDDEDDEEDEEEDDEEEEEEDGDDGRGPSYEDPGVSLITSKSAREHVFPILVQELVRENIISRNDGVVIMRQFAANNPVVSTALDKYDVNNDMAQLVDTLQQMVETLTTTP